MPSDNSIAYILSMGIGKRDSVSAIVQLTNETIGSRVSPLVKNRRPEYIKAEAAVSENVRKVIGSCPSLFSSRND